MKNSYYKIGDIVWVELNNEKHIQSGIRPAIIIQNNKGNYYSPNIQVIPLTSKQNKTHMPTHVDIPKCTGGLTKASVALCESVMLVSKSDIKGFIGKLPNYYMAKIAAATMINLPVILYLSMGEVNQIYDEISF